MWYLDTGLRAEIFLQGWLILNWAGIRGNVRAYSGKNKELSSWLKEVLYQEVRQRVRLTENRLTLAVSQTSTFFFFLLTML